MEDRLSRCLDGELDARELPLPLRWRAARWRVLFRTLRRRIPDRAPEGLAEGVMERVRAEDPGGGAEGRQG